MAARHKTPFSDLDEARLHAGFFVRDVCAQLEISERTWYRWQRRGVGPSWALRALKLLSGRLDFMGWDEFYIERGVLYSGQLSRIYYNWEPADLLVLAFCSCPAHQRVRSQRRGTVTTTTGGVDVAPTRRLRGARAPAFHLPGSVAAIADGDQGVGSG